MDIEILCGKGGVGKTNSSVSLALCHAKNGKKTAIIDYDGGHSVRNTLGISDEIVPNTIHETREGLSVVIVENTEFIGIGQAKKQGVALEKYFAQFPGSSGIMPLADMVNEFFGVPTDVPTLQKFTTLVTMLLRLEEEGFERVVIDVEPTAGLERLLSNALSTVRSLRNLKNQGKMALMALSVKWPDIAAYVRSDYIRHADIHCAAIERTVALIKKATYLLVCTPEAGPVAQTFDVRRIIQTFGGSVSGYIVNNIRDEPHEAAIIARLPKGRLPIVRIKRQDKLHSIAGRERIPLLLEIGKTIAAKIHGS